MVSDLTFVINEYGTMEFYDPLEYSEECIACAGEDFNQSDLLSFLRNLGFSISPAEEH